MSPLASGAVWLGGLVLAGVGAAIRAGAWTLESTPVPAPADPSGAEATADAAAAG